MNDLPLELELYLAEPEGAPASAAFRGNLLDQTEAMLPNPWPQWYRRFCLGTACALMLLAAIFVSTWQYQREPTRPADPAIVVPSPIEHSVPEPQPSSPTLSPAQSLEWQAFDSSAADRAKLYWNAGQTYVAAEGDYLGAIRCYRQALDSGSLDTNAITDEDDVLAMALKLEHQHKEKRNAVP